MTIRGAILSLLLAGGLASPARAEEATLAPNPALKAAVAGPLRSPKFVARDGARHPLEELSFFGLAPNATVVEIWPGGGYWTEVLAPFLHDSGTYYAAVPTGSEAADKEAAALTQKIAASPGAYGKIIVTKLGPTGGAVAPPASADVILTFRNLHNWMKDGDADAVLKDLFDALKPGGTLGIEEHRGRASAPQDPKALDGYVRQDYAVALAEKAGFRFVAASEINANPRDTADWPKGVWTLPPTLALGEVDRAKYMAVGEADNFVLKFAKPAP